LLISAQITTLTLNPNWDINLSRYTFFSLTSVFLGANSIVIILIIWLVDGRSWSLEEGINFIET
jgi:hypothetical protein